MVYRGKLSAGCDACRKAKKRCDLGEPSCTRCHKLNKPCSGYRDTTQLQVLDESASIRAKAENKTVVPVRTIEYRHNTQSSSSSTRPSSSAIPRSTPYHQSYLPLIGFLRPAVPGVSSGTNVHSAESSSPRIDATALEQQALHGQAYGAPSHVPGAIKPAPEDCAKNFFFKQFTSELGQWSYLREMFKNQRPEPALDLAVRVCGMASLDNVHGTGTGVDRSRPIYAGALRLLNAALRDPIRCKTDEVLIAVHLLGVYELLACDSRDSIMSWKAHMDGARKVLYIRGKAQFKTFCGRQLFREHRAQILIHAMWEDLECPSFLWGWDPELKKQSHPSELAVMAPADSLGRITIDYTTLRHKFRNREILDANAMSTARNIEERMIQWSIDTMAHSGMFWAYREIKVADSPHVWNGMVHGFSGWPGVPTIWNMYRTIRIMLTRTQEQILRRFELPARDSEAQLAYLRDVRKAHADGICGAVPFQLGHAAPAPNSPCIVVSAYGSIWPLFFAGTCALERVGSAAWMRVLAGNPLNEEATSANENIAQAAWIINRLVYISKHMGLRWADGLAATLNGDFEKCNNVPLDGSQKREPDRDPWRKQLHESDLGPLMMQKWRKAATEYGMIERQDNKPLPSTQQILRGS